jgi:S-adenosylmethionine-diacylglycerol 3-amino-3-carboxypropyl transferase
VIFRTAAEPSLLPGRVEPAILDRWCYDAEASRAFTSLRIVRASTRCRLSS